jgi:DNA-binding transcriptional ArsR family regulator
LCTSRTGGAVNAQRVAPFQHCPRRARKYFADWHCGVGAIVVILNPVVNSSLGELFAALADPTRREMVATLAERGPRTAGELAEPYAISLPAVSKHLAVLERVGLTTRTRRGRHHIISLNPKPLHHAAVWLERHHRFWTDRIDALERYLTEENR